VEAAFAGAQLLKRSRTRQHAARCLLASAGGIGYLRRGPASAAALAAAMAYAALRPKPRAQATALTVAVVGGYLVTLPLVTSPLRDPDFVVLDEVAGVWLALQGLPLDPGTCLGAAVVFRVLDRLKPGPVGMVDRLQSGWSVMGDDLVAGALTNFCWRGGMAAIDALR
jgi:phosphatidylglycerophosphatase A